MHGPPHSRPIGAIAAVILAVFVHGVHARSLGIYWDDAVQLMQTFQTANYDKWKFILSNPTASFFRERPADDIAFMISRAAFTFGLDAVYWTLLFLFLLSLVFVTRLARRLCNHEWFVFAAGTTFAFYPLAPLQTTWQATAPYHVSCLLTLGSIFAALWALEAAGGRRGIWLTVAAAAYAASLLTHEVFAFVPPAFVAAHELITNPRSVNSRSRRRTISSIGVFAAVFMLYAAWRTLILPRYGALLYRPEFPNDIAEIAKKVGGAAGVAFVPWPDVAFFLYESRPAATWIACALAAAVATWLLSTYLLRDVSDVRDQPWIHASTLGLAVFAAAVAVFAVSPAPLRTEFGVSHASRANFGVMIGLALALPALLVLAVGWARRAPAGAAAIVLAALLWAGLIGIPGRYSGVLFFQSYQPVVLGRYSQTYALFVLAYLIAVLMAGAAATIFWLRSRRRRLASAGSWQQEPGKGVVSGLILATILAGMVAFGSLVHFQTKQRFAEDWNRQLAMMQAFRQLAPNLSDGTFVIVADDRGYFQPWATHDWVSAYLFAIYGNASVFGNTFEHVLFYRDGIESTYHLEKRWIPPEGKVGYDRVVLFKYAEGTLSALPETEVIAGDGSRLVVKSRTERIQPGMLPTTPIWRYIAH